MTNIFKKFLILTFFTFITTTYSQKVKRGTRIFGKNALPLPLESINSKCSCVSSSNCWLVGDPHLKSFNNKFKKISVPKGEIIDIYTHDDFIINCTTYAHDIIDNIHFGNLYTWHIDDCNNKPGFLPSKSHTYTDGSVIDAKVYCRKSKNKIHINILLKKTNLLEDPMSFKDYEDFIESTGICNIT